MSEKSTPPAYYPLLLNLAGKHCLVIGGGEVALRKVAGLLDAGALVTVIAPRITAAMPAGTVLLRREFQQDDLDGAWLAFAATDDPEVNALVAREGERRRLWVNVVDDPAQCSMIIPAVFKRGALRIAVSTAGASPTLARQIGRELEQRYGPEYGELVELLWRLRRAFESNPAASRVPNSLRRHMWESVLRLPLLDLLRAGEQQHAINLAEEVIRRVVSGKQ
jgi:precorrin-2 dehydrogenase/sirohydrochlorin ferrochelatase